MITFVYDCPYCKAKHTGFEINGYKKFDGESGSNFSIMANCNRCTRAIVGNTRSLIYDDTASKFEEAITNQNKWSDLEQFYWTVGTIKFFPQPEKPDIPDYLPSDLENAFSEAEDLFCLVEENKFLKQAGNSYRAVIELALSKLDDNPADKNLNQRINQLADQGKLSPSMKDFAHRIRTLGNGASHALLEFSKKDLDDIRLFTRLFLMYAFTLPAMIPSEPKEEVGNKNNQ